MNGRPLEIYSWNINGVRAAVQKGLLGFIQDQKPDILGLQEVRAQAEQLPQELTSLLNHHAHFVAAERKGYSGVGLLVRRPPRSRLPQPSFDSPKLDKLKGHSKSNQRRTEELDLEGRLQSVRLGNLLIINGYFPNGDGKNRDNSRVPFKLEFYRRLRELLRPHVEAGEAILVMGDWNTAHRPIDLARPQQNTKTSGFLPEERAAFDEWTDTGWTDTFRHFHPVPDPFALPKRSGKELPPGGGHYTWWSQRFGVRERNVGWRIDYILASPGAMKYVRRARIFPEVMGSDHCPISVSVDPAVVQSPRNARGC